MVGGRGERCDFKVEKEERIVGSLYTLLVSQKVLDLLNLAGVMEMTRGNVVVLPELFEPSVLYNSSSHLNALGDGIGAGK